jgi:hypothetical protein
MDPAPFGLLVATLVAKQVLESAGGKAGESAWVGVTALAERLRGWFADNEDAEGSAALELVEAAPDSEAATGRLGAAVSAAVEADGVFRDELQALVAEAEQAGGAQVAKFLNNFHGPVGRVVQAETYYENGT